jgi:hypothetical protein
MSGLEALADGTYTVVVDAIEDSRARLFIEQDGEEVGDAVVSADRLPEASRHADAMLQATIADGALAALRYRPDETTERASAAQQRFDALSDRASSADKDESYPE